MKRSILMSIHPEWVELIASGEKTLEVRKRAPIEKPPFTVYVYETIPNHGLVNDSQGKVVLKFTCDYIQRTMYPADGLVDVIDEKNSCMTAREIVEYAAGYAVYFWHIKDVEVYKTPQKLSQFRIPGAKYPLMYPPQSFCYIEKIG